MSNKDECAYPSNYNRSVEPEYGLTKREYFAAKAMQGLLATGNYNDNDIAYYAVSVADAVLEELENAKIK